MLKDIWQLIKDDREIVIFGTVMFIFGAAFGVAMMGA